MQALWTVLTGNPTLASTADRDTSLLTDVVDALKPADDFGQPGTFQVTINAVQLDPSVFKPGHTVDIQAKVCKLGSGGPETTLWESKSYGERLAVVGRDVLTAGWPHRPFQVEWGPGDELVLEVYDAKPGLFNQPQRFTLSPADSGTPAFPLKSGDFPLAPARKPARPLDPRINHVVLQSVRLGGSRPQDQRTTQVAERPIVIK
jgi:hypothetical protein